MIYRLMKPGPLLKATGTNISLFYLESGLGAGVGVTLLGKVTPVSQSSEGEKWCS